MAALLFLDVYASATMYAGVLCRFSIFFGGVSYYEGRFGFLSARFASHSLWLFFRLWISSSIRCRHLRGVLVQFSTWRRRRLFHDFHVYGILSWFCRLQRSCLLSCYFKVLALRTRANFSRRHPYRVRLPFWYVSHLLCRPRRCRRMFRL